MTLAFKFIFLAKSLTLITSTISILSGTEFTEVFSSFLLYVNSISVLFEKKSFLSSFFLLFSFFLERVLSLVVAEISNLDCLKLLFCPERFPEKGLESRC